MDKKNFIYGKSSYRGYFQPNTLAFNHNLQEFATRVSYVSSLHTAGRLTSEQAYQQVNKLWKELKQSKKGLKL